MAAQVLLYSLQTSITPFDAEGAIEVHAVLLSVDCKEAIACQWHEVPRALEEGRFLAGCYVPCATCAQPSSSRASTGLTRFPFC